MCIRNVKNEAVVGSEQVYECKNDDRQQAVKHFNPYEYVLFNTFNSTMFMLKVLK